VLGKACQWRVCPKWLFARGDQQDHEKRPKRCRDTGEENRQQACAPQRQYSGWGQLVSSPRQDLTASDDGERHSKTNHDGNDVVDE
jgi:hypothetical protein